MMVVESQSSNSRAQEDHKSQQEVAEMMERDKQLRIKRLNETMRTKLNEVNVFENTTPAAPATAEGSGHGPLSGVDPKDAGVDITGIMRLAGGDWKRMI